MVVGGQLIRSLGRSSFFRQTSAFLGENSKLLTVPNWKRFCLAAASPKVQKNKVTVTFVTRDGKRHTVQTNEGDTVLDAHNNNHLEFAGYGNCGGTMSCSTCLVHLDEEVYKEVESTQTEEEIDIIDLSGSENLTCCRLGCQLRVTKALDGLVVTVPDLEIKDLRDS